MKPVYPRIVFDCDDVLLDWTKGFYEYLTYLGRPPSQPRPSSWDMTDWVGPDALELVTDFNLSRRFELLDPCEDATSTVRLLHELNFEIVVVTACGTDNITVDRRNTNLRRIFGHAINRIICLPLGMSKAEILSSWAPGVFIDDHLNHVQAAHELGYASYLMTRPHNQNLLVPEGIGRTDGFIPFMYDMLTALHESA
jgi:FMN phosphatase YigB (HAD superfamily)